jgi:Arc/MetJ-type ribon-helix-helix transcriptional regulator
MSEITTWIENRLPEEWFEGQPSVSVDREEIVIIGRLSPVEAPKAEEGGEETHASVAEEARIARFREETRRQRMRIADETEVRFGRKVSWGAACGDTTILFTNLSVPVMTRLRQSDRQVLDTLVAAGVARSRSDALAWCVRLVADHEGDWIDKLRESLKAVNEARAAGPSPSRNNRSSRGDAAPPQA